MKFSVETILDEAEIRCHIDIVMENQRRILSGTKHADFKDYNNVNAVNKLFCKSALKPDIDPEAWTTIDGKPCSLENFPIINGYEVVNTWSIEKDEPRTGRAGWIYKQSFIQSSDCSNVPSIESEVRFRVYKRLQVHSSDVEKANEILNSMDLFTSRTHAFNLNFIRAALKGFPYRLHLMYENRRVCESSLSFDESDPALWTQPLNYLLNNQSHTTFHHTHSINDAISCNKDYGENGFQTFSDSFIRNCYPYGDVVDGQDFEVSENWSVMRGFNFIVDKDTDSCGWQYADSFWQRDENLEPLMFDDNKLVPQMQWYNINEMNRDRLENDRKSACQLAKEALNIITKATDEGKGQIREEIADSCNNALANIFLSPNTEFSKTSSTDLAVNIVRKLSVKRRLWCRITCPTSLQTTLVRVMMIFQKHHPRGVFYSGSLMKRGHFIASWRQRRFEVSDEMICYYSGKRRKGRMTLVDCFVSIIDSRSAYAQYLRGGRYFDKFYGFCLHSSECAEHLDEMNFFFNDERLSFLVEVMEQEENADSGENSPESTTTDSVEVDSSRNSLCIMSPPPSPSPFMPSVVSLVPSASGLNASSGSHQSLRDSLGTGRKHGSIITRRRSFNGSSPSLSQASSRIPKSRRRSFMSIISSEAGGIPPDELIMSASSHKRRVEWVDILRSQIAFISKERIYDVEGSPLFFPTTPQLIQYPQQSASSVQLHEHLLSFLVHDGVLTSSGDEKLDFLEEHYYTHLKMLWEQQKSKDHNSEEDVHTSNLRKKWGLRKSRSRKERLSSSRNRSSESLLESSRATQAQGNTSRPHSLRQIFANNRLSSKLFGGSKNSSSSTLDEDLEKLKLEDGTVPTIHEEALEELEDEMNDKANAEVEDEDEDEDDEDFDDQSDYDSTEDDNLSKPSEFLVTVHGNSVLRRIIDGFIVGKKFINESRFRRRFVWFEFQAGEWRFYWSKDSKKPSELISAKYIAVRGIASCEMGNIKSKAVGRAEFVMATNAEIRRTVTIWLKTRVQFPGIDILFSTIEDAKEWMDTVSILMKE